MFNMKKIIIIAIIIVILASFIYIMTNIINGKKEVINELIPEQELSDEQLRKTKIELYFISNNGIVKEEREIDVKELVKNPYKKVIDMIIEGPENTKYERIISKDVKINSIIKEKDILIIDLTKEFTDYLMEKDLNTQLAIEAITKTMTQFNEINTIKLLIDGNENCII